MPKSLKIAGCAILLATSSAAPAHSPSPNGASSPSIYYRMLWLFDMFGGNRGSCHRNNSCG